MLPQPRLRFLLADDAGAGKTIMAGLYIREMLTRRLLRRVIVIPPAGLVGNWRRELNGLFSLPFKIVTGPDARSGNPFTGPGSDLVIISVDTLSSGTAFGRLTEPGVEPYDLAIFDEAHKLSARRDPDFTIEKTQRYELAEYLSRVCRHLMLLTATPHMGKDYSYFALWQLLEPDVLTTPDAFYNYPPSARARHFIRRSKEEKIDFDGNPLYKKRESHTASYDLSPSEQKLYDATTEYIELYYNKARMLNRSAARLAMRIFQRRLASSTYSLLRSFERRLAKLDYWINEVESGNLTMETLLAQQKKKDTEVEDITDSKTGDEESTEDGKEENEVKEDEAMTGVIASTLAELRAERDRVAELLGLAKLADADPSGSSKFEKLREVLTDDRFKDQKILIFTEFRDTLDFLVKRFQARGFTDDIAIIHGGLPFGDREDQIEAFRKGKILVATDAAGEGLNMQFCWLMFNYLCKCGSSPESVGEYVDWQKARRAFIALVPEVEVKGKGKG